MKRFTPILLATTLLASTLNTFTPMSAQPANCVDVQVVWANGSGADINGSDNNYLDFRNAVQHELMKTPVSYSFYELGTSAHGGYQYPAASVGVRSLEEIWRTVQAKLGAGESYEYGESALEGAMEMREYVREVSAMCPDTRFVLGGLSQGGQVVSWAIQDIDPEKVLYAATFGDPKLYLPEGKYGKNSAACKNIYYNNYSEYRAYVPDCEAYEGILKARVPYQPAGYSGKLGAWCSYHDVMCSSHINWLDLWEDSLAPHGSYGKAYFAYDLYGDAANIIRTKVMNYFQYGQHTTGIDNVVIVLDRSAYMSEEVPVLEYTATVLADSVFDRGGKVALYRIGADRQMRLVCGFSASAPTTCDSNMVYENSLADIDYDVPQFYEGVPGWSIETGALYNAMSTMSWDQGADKKVILLTNAAFAVATYTLDELVELSKNIDPVNVYTATPSDLVDSWSELTGRTGGRSITLEELGRAYNGIDDFLEAERIVRSGWEEPDGETYDVATISDVETEIQKDNSLKISYKTEKAHAVGVFLNDALVGIANTDGVVLTGVDYSMQNDLMLVPYPEEGYAGESVEKKIDIYTGKAEPTEIDDKDDDIKAPDCGVVKPMMWWSKELAR